MVRRLIVMRHCKSSWADAEQTDHQRPLNDRGRRDAPQVARALAARDWIPEFILSSDSLRTRETCELMRQAWETEIETDFVRGLYQAGVEDLRRALPCVPHETSCLLLLGHNPGWEQVVFRLCQEQLVMKTGTAVLLQSDCQKWTDALNSRWLLVEAIHPREL